MTIFIFSILCASCGKYIDKSTINSKVNDDNEISLKFDTTLQNIDFNLPIVQVPIYNFKNHQFIGQLNLQEGKRIILELNMTKIFNEAIATECLLPNGNPIPHVFEGREQLFCFDTKDNMAKIYVAIEDDIAIP